MGPQRPSLRRMVAAVLRLVWTWDDDLHGFRVWVYNVSTGM
jgi:hypothetical protein